MELRKVQETGGSFFVSLPRGWAQRIGLTKGSVVEVIEREDGSLVVDPQYGLERRVEEATVTPSPLLEREITGKYLLGFNTIKIEGVNRLPPEVSEKARQTARRMIGLEIVEEDAHRIVLQCLLEPSAFPPEKILRREYLFASGMHKDVLTALVEGDTRLAGAIVERDDEVDRLYFLLVRLLRTAVLNPRLTEKMGLSLIDCLDYRLVASYVESIADHANVIARSIGEFSGTSLPEDVLHALSGLGERSYEMHQKAMRALFSRDLNLVGEVLEENDSVQDAFRKLDKLLAGKSPDVIAYASTVASALNQICDSAVDIADIVMPI